MWKVCITYVPALECISEAPYKYEMWTWKKIRLHFKACSSYSKAENALTMLASLNLFTSFCP